MFIIPSNNIKLEDVGVRRSIFSFLLVKKIYNWRSTNIVEIFIKVKKPGETYPAEIWSWFENNNTSVYIIFISITAKGNEYFINCMILFISYKRSFYYNSFYQLK